MPKKKWGHCAINTTASHKNKSKINQIMNKNTQTHTLRANNKNAPPHGRTGTTVNCISLKKWEMKQMKHNRETKVVFDVENFHNFMTTHSLCVCMYGFPLSSGHFSNFFGGLPLLVSLVLPTKRHSSFV